MRNERPSFESQKVFTLQNGLFLAVFGRFSRQNRRDVSPEVGLQPVFLVLSFENLANLFPSHSTPEQFPVVGQQDRESFRLGFLVLELSPVLYRALLNLHGFLLGFPSVQVQQPPFAERLYQVRFRHLPSVFLVDEFEELEIHAENLVIEDFVQRVVVGQVLDVEVAALVPPQFEFEPRQLFHAFLLELVEEFLSLHFRVLDLVVDSRVFPRVLLRVFFPDSDSRVRSLVDERPVRRFPLFQNGDEDVPAYPVRIREYVKANVDAFETVDLESQHLDEFHPPSDRTEYQTLSSAFENVPAFRATGLVPFPDHNERHFDTRRPVDDFEILLVLPYRHVRDEIQVRLLVVRPKVRISRKPVEPRFFPTPALQVGLEIVYSEMERLPLLVSPHFPLFLDD